MHRWVAYVVMPIFALNAGVSLRGTDLSTGGRLVIGDRGCPGRRKAARRRRRDLGHGAAGAGAPCSGRSVGGLPVGMVAGIGFTMSIFISMLAFRSRTAERGQKLGVLLDLARRRHARTWLGGHGILRNRRKRLRWHFNAPHVSLSRSPLKISLCKSPR